MSGGYAGQTAYQVPDAAVDVGYRRLDRRPRGRIVPDAEKGF
jgi:hypothetical protein